MKKRIPFGRKAVVTAVMLMLLCLPAFAALRISNYYSPWNRKRAVRPYTKYIVLHTTEGASKGSRNKIHKYGEANYFVDTDGKVLRIIDKNRIAAHAGRSMWNGLRNIDSYSIGIEVVGYHNKSLTAAQVRAIKELVEQLQKIYRISDKNVLCHAMVAYGAPNRWHRRSHRGRKRCGMLFARSSVRKTLGLSDKWSYDPDVRAGRLTVGDKVLESVLYSKSDTSGRSVATGKNVISARLSAWDIARDKYNSSSTTYVFPDGTRKKGNQIRKWKSMPAGTKVILKDSEQPEQTDKFRVVGRDGTTARELAGDDYRSKTVIYFLPDGKVRRGDEMSSKLLARLPGGTKVLVGYTYGGYITAKRSAFDICGKKWNYPSTLYRFPDGSFKTGAELNESVIPRNTVVFFRE